MYIDSPLAKKATTIFTGDLRGYLDEEALELVQDGTHMFSFSNLRMTETSEESKALNMDRTPKVIISASGMCDAGRIRHHLKHNLWRPECTVVFVGYQGEGTLGRSLLEGVGSVKLFGEEIAVHAKIVNFQGLSSHADRDHLISWIQSIQAPKPQHVFVVHGDREVAPFFAKTVQSLGFTAHAPQYTEVYDLIAGKVTEPGYLPERKAGPPAASGPAPPTSGWWPWATCSWSPSSAAAGGTTSPWRASPNSCASSWRSGRAETDRMTPARGGCAAGTEFSRPVGRSPRRNFYGTSSQKTRSAPARWRATPARAAASSAWTGRGVRARRRPGETIDLKITKVMKAAAAGEIVRITSPLPTGRRPSAPITAGAAGATSST